MKQFKWHELTVRQKNAARMFSEVHGSMTVSQCAKYLNYIFAYTNNRITAEQFKAQTNHAVSDKWKAEQPAS